MAKIVLAPEAPDDLNSVSLANAVVDEFPFDTTDPTILGNAAKHPFLNVEYDPADEVETRYRESDVDPTTDPLSASNPASRLPFDAAAVKEAEDAKAEATAPVAIEAGLDQDEPVEHGGVAETFAAFDTHVTASDDDAQTNADAGDVS